MTDEEDLVAQVEKITSAAGVRIFLDSIAGPGLKTWPTRFSTLRVHLCLRMALAAANPFPLFATWQKSLKVQGYTLFEITGKPKLLQQATKYVFDKLDSGAFKPFEQIAEAHRSGSGEYAPLTNRGWGGTPKRLDFRFLFAYSLAW